MLLNLFLTNGIGAQKSEFNAEPRTKTPFFSALLFSNTLPINLFQINEQNYIEKFLVVWTQVDKQEGCC